MKLYSLQIAAIILFTAASKEMKKAIFAVAVLGVLVALIPSQGAAHRAEDQHVNKTKPVSMKPLSPLRHMGPTKFFPGHWPSFCKLIS